MALPPAIQLNPADKITRRGEAAAFAIGSNRCMFAAPSARAFVLVWEDITMKLSRLASFAAILLCALELSGCANTVRGAAKDVTSTVDAAVE